MAQITLFKNKKKNDYKIEQLSIYKNDIITKQ